MSLFKEMRDIKEMVHYLLSNHPHLRDNDYKLVATFHLFEAGGREILDNMTATKFLQMYADAKLTNFESIRRVRQKLQEENPDLRGEKWISRKAKGNKFNTEGI